MKAQHRHELETNRLAKELNVWGEKLRPYSSLMLMGVAAVLALYAVLSMWNAHAATREDQAWFDYEKAVLANEPDFQSVRRSAVSDDLAGSRMQEWAYVAWADRQLSRAASEYLLNRESSKDRTAGIATVYEQTAENAADAEVRNRARLGLARVRELQNRLDDARKEYARVEGALQPVAAARLKELEANEKDVSAVATWLAMAELPTPAAPTGAGLPGVRPDFGAAPPSAEGAGDPFNPAQTMEEILGGADDTEGGRYGEGAATDNADAGAGTAAEGGADAAGAATDAVAPEDAATAGGEPGGAAAGGSGDVPAAGDESSDAGGAAAEPESTDGKAPAGP